MKNCSIVLICFFDQKSKINVLKNWNGKPFERLNKEQQNEENLK